MYNEKINNIRNLLSLIGFKPCVRGDISWLEYTNGIPKEPGHKVGSWRFQQYPIGIDELKEHVELSLVEQLSGRWQLVYNGWGSVPGWHDEYGTFISGGFNVDDVSMEYIMSYFRKIFTVEWSNIRDYYIDELLQKQNIYEH